MVGAGESVLEKFQIQKELGYDGVEFISPTQIDLNEVVAASKETKMPVHGLVNMKHWEIRMSSADEKQRREAVQIMKKCIEDVKHLGGDSVLLVPGQVTGKDETHDDVWKRSIECIRQVIPLAAENKIQILIENVWNGFCEKPQQLCDYIDEIDSEWVKVYFDIGNARKFAPSEEWIRMLGQRIIKLDVKDWGRENGFCKIGDGDVDWPAVCRELDALQFIGWSTAEVEGGGRDRLQDIASRMDRVLIE
jgi:hexulose-6-phosphate isomerase